MRRITGLWVLAALFLAPATAVAGPPARDTGGDFLVLQVKPFPPRAGAAVGLDFDSFSGNDLTSPAPNQVPPNEFARTLEVRFPRGFKANLKFFRACKEQALTQSGPSACPRGSRIGKGTATVDARPLFPTFVHATTTAFVGKTRAGRRGVLVYARTSFGATQVLATTLRRPRGRFGPSLLLDFGPQPAPGSVTFSLAELHLTIPRKAIRSKGRRIPLLRAPRRCRHSWRFQQVNTDYRGTKLVANDRAPCVR